MILDTSALVALLLEEPEQLEFTRQMHAAPIRRISAGSWVELTVVLSRRGDPSLFNALEIIRSAFPFEIMPVTADQAEIAAQAYREYGRGSEHRARLNYGDCFSYALAKATGEPLLFKGDDFIHTDIRPAA